MNAAALLSASADSIASAGPGTRETNTQKNIIANLKNPINIRYCNKQTTKQKTAHKNADSLTCPEADRIPDTRPAETAWITGPVTAR
jgi:hypothetical protein